MSEEETREGARQEDDAARQIPQIVDTGSVVTSGNGCTIHCLTVIGQIEGHYILPSQNKTTKYEHVIPQLVAIEEDPAIDGLLMLLNTVGGCAGYLIFLLMRRCWRRKYGEKKL